MFIAEAFNFQYLDDWLIQAGSEELCAQHTQRVLLLCSELALVVNHQKSELTPSRQFLFLGYIFDMIKYQCSPPQKRMDKFLVIIQHILRGQGAIARLARPPGIFRESRSSGQTTHEGDYVLPV